jgi:cell division protein FtsI/penicillin-binding protein 2
MVQTEQYSRRLSFLLIFFIAFFSVIGIKLFYLQVVKHNFYLQKALADHQGYTELDSRRGEIYLQDYHSSGDFRVATNTTLDTVFADPFLIEDPLFVADNLYPLLFDAKIAQRAEENRLKEQRKTLPADLTEEEVNDILKPKSLEELKLEFRNEVLGKISQKVRQQIILYTDPDDSIRSKVKALRLPGIEVQDKQIVAFPPQITDTKEYAGKLTAILEIEPERLEKLFEGQNRYTVLARKIEPDNSEKIRELVKNDKEAYRGIGFEQKSYRFYPEKRLASQVLGFVDSQGGRYGVEESYDDLLKGRPGLFKTKLDGLGKQITVGNDTVIKPAEDGSDVYLTIERSVQMEVERLLEEKVKETDADGGQVIVMEPDTGNILAMAHYPTYDPNEFWTALDTEEVFLEDLYKDEEELQEGTANPELESRQNEIITFNYASGDEHYLIVDDKLDKRLRILPVKSEKSGETYYEKFKNEVGAAVYRNRLVQDIYEPGSVFKAITMAAAIDDGNITPNDTVNDTGPIKVDEFWIDNALSKHYGIITMTQVLETSNNIGIAWITQKLGRNLMYSYIKKFGFGLRTDVQLEGEKTGKIESFTTWADSELVTHGFGQGISVTPLQMITAFAALANDGVLLQPNLVKQLVHSDGTIEEIDPVIVRRVVSKKTADTLVAMLTSVVENGQAKGALVDNYLVAGKTGTSQTYRNGVPLEGLGTTIASFAGFAPASDPEFVILVKIDKPRTSQWGSDVAAPLFGDIASYILQYQNIPPDDL